MKIYLICPVRGVVEAEKEFLDSYVSSLESAGHQVHYPPRDVDQSDGCGLRILKSHKDAMRDSDIVRMFYSPSSMGSYFDLGMSIMASKPVKTINPVRVTRNDPVSKLIMEYSSGSEGISNIFNQTIKRRRELLEKNFVAYRGWDSKNPFMLLDLGMIFMAGVPLMLVEGHGVKPTEGKSFDNVVLRLSEIYHGPLPRDFDKK